MTKKNIVKLVVNFVLIAILIVGTSVGSAIAFRFEQEINSLLSPPIVDEEAMEQSSATGQAMSRRIMEEGAVLLKNNGALPLDKSIRQVNVFGWRSVDWIYGSEGFNASGGVAPEDGDIDKNIDICKALNAYGVQYNRRLYDMYCNYYKPDRQSENLRGTHISNLISLTEPNISNESYYTPDLLSYSKEFSDTAIVVIGRMAGEGMNANISKQSKRGTGSSDDSSRHYLEISTEEEALLTYVGANYENVIVLLSVANPFECGFLDTIDGIDACFYIGFTGTRGASAIPSLLYGDVSPSGRTVDTFPYDAFTNPGNVFLDKTYTDADNKTSYMDIVENIYIGYKWYETADTMGVWNDYTLYDGEKQKTGYNAVVQFPFGHGLSYTTFDWTVKGFYIHDDELGEGEEPTELAPGSNITDKTKIDVVVNVKNTGSVRGRDVVEAYVTAPYVGGGIEKASVSLVGFNKTNVLEPGGDEDITVTLDAYDFASYDCYGLNNEGEDTHTGWELDAGTYTISLRTDSHTVKEVYYKDGENKQAGSFDYNIAELINIDVDPITNQPVDNLFTGEKTVDFAPLDAKSKDGSFDPGIPWFTRADFKKPSEWAEMNVARAATPGIKDVNQYSEARAKDWDEATVNEFGEEISDVKPTWGANNGLKLAENGILTELGKKLGENYDADEWKDVLDQVTTAEFRNTMNGYYSSKAINSVGKPQLADYDGPSQIKGFTDAVPRGTGYPTMVIIAGTWNPNLAYEFGKAYGDDMKSVGVSGLWGWAIDNHRSAFFGRNHESPSEDAYFAGKIIENAVKGLNTRGRYCFIKHFAVYGYGGNNIWMTEQTLRENYIKQFRMAFVNGGALGCMTTYQGIGAEHTETSIALLTGVLRREWAFNGAITTDAIGHKPYCASIFRAGGNLGMGVSLVYGDYNESSTARVQNRMRDSVHQVLYMWLRSNYNERMYALNPDQNDTILTTSSINTWSWWQPLITCLVVLVVFGCIMWGALITISIFMKSDKQKLEAAAAVATAANGETPAAENDLYETNRLEPEPEEANAEPEPEPVSEKSEITDDAQADRSSEAVSEEASETESEQSETEIKKTPRAKRGGKSKNTDRRK